MPHQHLPKLSDADFRQLQQLMLEASGIHMTDQKRILMAGRLMGRLRAVGAGTFWTGMVDYSGGKSAEEVAAAIDASWPK